MCLLILEKNVSYFKVIIELDKFGGVHAVFKKYFQNKKIMKQGNNKHEVTREV